MSKILLLLWIWRCQPARSFMHFKKRKNDSNANHNETPNDVIPQPCDGCALETIQDNDLSA